MPLDYNIASERSRLSAMLGGTPAAAPAGLHPSQVPGQVARDMHQPQGMMQMPRVDPMQASFQRQGVGASSLRPSGFATTGTGGISDSALADGKSTRMCFNVVVCLLPLEGYNHNHAVCISLISKSRLSCTVTALSRSTIGSSERCTTFFLPAPIERLSPSL